MVRPIACLPLIPSELFDLQVFAQLIVFSAMAAFADQFDVTNGIASNPDQEEADAILQTVGYNQNDLAASLFRANRLPLLNSKGISIALGLSRLVLLMQYLAGMLLPNVQVISNSLDEQSSTTLASNCCLATRYGPI